VSPGASDEVGSLTSIALGDTPGTGLAPSRSSTPGRGSKSLLPSVAEPPPAHSVPFFSFDSDVGAPDAAAATTAAAATPAATDATDVDDGDEEPAAEGEQPSPARPDAQRDDPLRTSQVRTALRTAIGGSLIAERHLSIGGMIGRGGYASVHKGTLTTTHPDTHEPMALVVAVKRIHKFPTHGPELTRLLREVGLMHALTHPNLLRIIGVSASSECLSLITELMPRTADSDPNAGLLPCAVIEAQHPRRDLCPALRLERPWRSRPCSRRRLAS
jgi:hypothetical protein